MRRSGKLAEQAKALLVGASAAGRGGAHANARAGAAVSRRVLPAAATTLPARRHVNTVGACLARAPCTCSALCAPCCHGGSSCSLQPGTPGTAPPLGGPGKQNATPRAPRRAGVLAACALFPAKWLLTSPSFAATHLRGAHTRILPPHCPHTAPTARPRRAMNNGRAARGNAAGRRNHGKVGAQAEPVQ